MQSIRNAAIRLTAACALATLLLAWGPPAPAEPPAGPPGIIVHATSHGFQALWTRLEQAVKSNKLGIVGRASASKGAAARGIEIPGNAVIMVFRNDLAVRMLEASVPAGIEAPLRFYVTENADGTATLTYRKPSAVFAPYGGDALMALADELDRMFARIAEDAIGG